MHPPLPQAAEDGQTTIASHDGVTVLLKAASTVRGIPCTPPWVPAMAVIRTGFTSVRGLLMAGTLFETVFVSMGTFWLLWLPIARQHLGWHLLRVRVHTVRGRGPVPGPCHTPCHPPRHTLRHPPRHTLRHTGFKLEQHTRYQACVRFEGSGGVLEACDVTCANLSCVVSLAPLFVMVPPAHQTLVTRQPISPRWHLF